MALLHLPSTEISPISKVLFRRYFGDEGGGLLASERQACRLRVIGQAVAELRSGWRAGEGTGACRGKSAFRAGVSPRRLKPALKRASYRSGKPLRHPKAAQPRVSLQPVSSSRGGCGSAFS
jgi:hypothetical protein